MKTMVRMAVVTAVLAASAASVTPAFADTWLPDTGNGEAVLYVRNVTTDLVYARGLGVRLDSLLTQSQIAATSYTGTVIDKQSTGIDVAADQTLKNFLGANPSSSNFEWGVIAGDTLFQSTTGTKNAGEFRYLTTTTFTLDGANPGVSNLNLRSTFANLQPVTQILANGTINSGVNGDMKSGVNTTPAQMFSPNAVPSVYNWYGNGLDPHTALGQAANLYLLATNGTASGTGGSSGTRAEVYQFANLTLKSNGDLVSAVPIPAALWLFGSGLLGLAGIGRRQRASAA